MDGPEPARRMRMPRKSARLWHAQCGNWKQGTRFQNLDSRLAVSRAKWWFQTKSSPMVDAPLGSAEWTSRAKKPSRGAWETRSLKGNVWQRRANKKEKGCNPVRLWFLSELIAGLFYLALSRSGEVDNPGPACPTAKLYDAQFDAIGRWTANMTSKNEVELTSLFAQVGECRHNWSERFHKESDPHTSSVGPGHPRHSQSHGSILLACFTQACTPSSAQSANLRLSLSVS